MLWETLLEIIISIFVNPLTTGIIGAIIGAVFGYLFDRKMVKYRMKLENRKEFKNRFLFFLERWENFKYAINNLILKEPQNGEISWVGNELEMKLNDVIDGGVKFDSNTEDTIRRVASDLRNLGLLINNAFPDLKYRINYSPPSQKVITSLLQEGDRVYSELEAIHGTVSKCWKQKRFIIF